MAILAYKMFVKKSKGLSSKVDCNKRFLFIGDSLTEYSNSYADQLSAICPNINIKKISKVGEKTDWMLSQLQNELNNNTYDVITIWGGVNDIYASNSIGNAQQNLQNMYDLASRSGAKVVALTVIPTATYNVSDNQKVRLTKDINNWIISNSSLDAIIDANYILNDGHDGTKAEYLQSDTLHITSLGHRIISEDYAGGVINI